LVFQIRHQMFESLTNGRVSVMRGDYYYKYLYVSPICETRVAFR
jgi:hypothetical protein